MLERNHCASTTHKMLYLLHVPLFQGLAQRDLDELNRVITVIQIQ